LVIRSQIVLSDGRTPFMGVVFSVWLTWIGLVLTAGLVWRLSSSDVLSWMLVEDVASRSNLR
jgi:hypothetical protein